MESYSPRVHRAASRGALVTDGHECGCRDLQLDNELARVGTHDHNRLPPTRTDDRCLLHRGSRPARRQSQWVVAGQRTRDGDPLFRARRKLAERHVERGHRSLVERVPHPEHTQASRYRHRLPYRGSLEMPAAQWRVPGVGAAGPDRQLGRATCREPTIPARSRSPRASPAKVRPGGHATVGRVAVNHGTSF